jgi:endonuclease YncB( thermonuclease family)
MIFRLYNMGNCFNRNPKQSEIDEFRTHNFGNSKTLSFDGEVRLMRIVDIYDGDTTIGIIKQNNEFILITVRLAEIDTCEIKSKDERAKELAFVARNRLFELVTGGKTIESSDNRNKVRNLLNSDNFVVLIKCGKFDKYGRVLGYLYKNNDVFLKTSFNSVLVKEKLAYTYMGDTKLTEEEQIALLSKN